MAPAPSPSSPAPDLDRSWKWGAKREMGVRGRASGNQGERGCVWATERDCYQGEKKKKRLAVFPELPCPVALIDHGKSSLRYEDIR